MDIQLPIMNGYEATRRIKADPTLTHVPVIAVTSLSGDGAKARAAGTYKDVIVRSNDGRWLFKERKAVAQ